MNNNDKGNLASKLFDIECIKFGFGVSEPIQELRYDKIVDIRGVLFRVQIKYCDRQMKKQEGVYSLSLRIQRNNKIFSKGYSKEEIDALVVYLPYNQKFYWFPPEIFHNKESLTLRTKQTERNNPNTLEISKYEFNGVLA